MGPALIIGEGSGMDGKSGIGVEADGSRSCAGAIVSASRSSDSLMTSVIVS